MSFNNSPARRTRCAGSGAARPPSPGSAFARCPICGDTVRIRAGRLGRHNSGSAPAQVRR